MNHWEASVAWRAFNFNWILVALFGVSLVFLADCGDFSIEPRAFGITLSIALLLAMVSYGHALARRDQADPKLIFWLGTTSQVVLLTTFAGPLSYVVNSFNWPLQDQALLRVDRAFGLDPQWIAALINEHAWLMRILDSGYSFIKWPLLAIPVILSMVSGLVRLQQFVLSLSIALAATIMTSAFVPAVGTYYGMGVAPETMFPLVNSSYYVMQLRDILALRDGSLRYLELYKLVGIVSFPSFHGASAVLYIWALWPVRGFRWIAIFLNIWMIVATPIVGAHYVVDIIGGVAVAAGSVVLAKHLVQLVTSDSVSNASGELATEAVFVCEISGDASVEGFTASSVPCVTKQPEFVATAGPPTA